MWCGSVDKVRLCVVDTSNLPGSYTSSIFVEGRREGETSGEREGEDGREKLCSL